jgi:CRISPR-associated protein Cas1
VSLFGNVMVSPGAMQLCAEAGISMTFLSESGRLLARVDGPISGNVLLRRKQFRQADETAACITFSRGFVAGKIQNCRANLLRAARDNAAEEDQASLRWAAEELASSIRRLAFTQSLDEIRGTEGNAARVYFGAFGSMIRADLRGCIYSFRRETTGSTRDARRARSKLAKAATASSMKDTSVTIGTKSGRNP